MQGPWEGVGVMTLIEKKYFQSVRPTSVGSERGTRMQQGMRLEGGETRRQRERTERREQGKSWQTTAGGPPCQGTIRTDAMRG
eukprot:762509-Hanusia_phi.AAC.11